MMDAAIVGLGRWGQALVDSVQGKSKAIRFTHAVTRTPAKVKEYCAENGLSLSDDYAAMLADPDINAVVLATPHTLHADQIIRAAEAGKHVFCEKPFTLTGASAASAVVACKKAGVTVALGHNRRFLPSTIELKRMIDAGELGTMMHVETNFSADLHGNDDAWRGSRAESPAGGMTSLGIHALDCLIHLCGEIVEVDVRSRRRVLPFDIDDTTAMLFEFANGMTGYLGTMAAGGRLWYVRVFGSEGWVELNGLERLVRNMTGTPEVIDYPVTDSLNAELEAFAEAAGGGTPYIITPGQIVHATSVLEAIIKGAENGTREAIT